jgi:hypothetical protein
MKRPSFFEGVGVALAAAIGGGILFTVLTSLFAGGFVLRLLITALGLLYTLYLLHRSGEKVGRITSVTIWLVAASSIWLLGLSLPLFVMAHLGLIWLVRSLYFYSILISALADLGLVLFGFAAAVWALVETGNLFLSIWSFFLIQALFVVIPDSWKRPRNPHAAITLEEDRFQHAYRVADAAVSKISSAR